MLVVCGGVILITAVQTEARFLRCLQEAAASDRPVCHGEVSRQDVSLHVCDCRVGGGRPSLILGGCRLKQCGEDLLMDVSEVLFNELAFFKMMEDCRG